MFGIHFGLGGIGIFKKSNHYPRLHIYSKPWFLFTQDRNHSAKHCWIANGDKKASAVQKGTRQRFPTSGSVGGLSCRWSDTRFFNPATDLSSKMSWSWQWRDTVLDLMFLHLQVLRRVSHWTQNSWMNICSIWSRSKMNFCVRKKANTFRRRSETTWIEKWRSYWTKGMIFYWRTTNCCSGEKRITKHKCLSTGWFPIKGKIRNRNSIWFD